MASTRAHCTPNACTPKLRNIYRSSPVSKCSGGMSNGVPLVDHSRNSSFFLDSKQFVCSICHKYTFNINHDDCITKILNKVNSRAKVQSLKIRNNNPVEPKNHTPRSCLRWKPTGRNFKAVSLRWIPTGKMFTDSTTKVDSEPPNGSNDDITNPYECNQTLYFSTGTSNSSAGTSVNPLKERLRGIHCISKFPSIYIQLFWNTLTHDAKTGRSLLHDNIIPKPDLALELGKSISLTEAKEEAVAREVHATHARISKKLKGIQTLTPTEQEAADIMKALKESKKISKRQPRTGGSNEGTGNILGVPDESTVISRASSEGTGSKPGVPDEEKLIL
ncbi:hypothetical protein Tco_1541796 [Tanacetum coccineum]